ncbi:MAG: conjugative transfer protein MobI(A/C) [Acidiferrobacteraceae bacterium]
MSDTEPHFTDALRTLLQGELAALKLQAERLADDYWTWRIHEDKQRPAKERSHLGLRVRDTASGSFSAEWYAFEWKATKDGNKQRFRGMRKGTGASYPDRVLVAEGRAWEWERVRVIEAALADLRRRAKIIGKLRFQSARYAPPGPESAAGRAPADGPGARASEGT